MSSTDQEYDVVIVGAGVAGCLVARELSAAGYGVLVLEAGPTPTAQDRNKYIQKFYEAEAKSTNAPYPPYPGGPPPGELYAPSFRVLNIGAEDPKDEYLEQMGPQPFSSSYERIAGGTTWHWLGVAYRLLPDDFQLRTLYGHGVDWPIGYNDLQPWYCKAEEELRVSGSVGAQEQLGLWFTPGYSYPQGIVAQSYLDKQLSTLLGDLQFDGNPVQVYSLPQARNSTDPTQQRPACQGNTSCIPICPIQAKWDATVFLDQAADSAEIRYQTVVTRLHLHPATKAVASLDFVQYDKPAHGTTTTGSVRAKVFILAAHAIENVKVLKMSATEGFEEGLANSSDALGRYLMDHPLQLSWARTKDPVYSLRGPRVAGHRGACETVPSGRSAEASRGHRQRGVELGLQRALHRRHPFGRARRRLARAVGRRAARGAQPSTRPAVQARIPGGAGASAQNRVSLSPDRTDGLGLPVPPIEYELGDC